MAVAREQEMRAAVVEAEAQVPLALADALRSGRIGVMDVYRMAPLPDNEDVPEPAVTTKLKLEQAWKEAPGMAGLADVFEQDMSNFTLVQQGLKSNGKKTVTFGNYQEGRLRHIHKTIDKFIVDGLKADGRSLDELAPFAVINND
jgi:hypothetical protein